MTPENIVEVNETTFEYEVISFSKNIPVLVDFWAEWCQPCRVLTPLMEKVVNEAGGNLRLAKVNIDQNPNLAIQYNVRSIPTVKAFIDSQVIAEFVGVIPEQRLREFISKLVPPSPLDLEMEKAHNLLLSHNWDEAREVLEDILRQRPESNSAHLGLAIAMLGLNQPDEAVDHLDMVVSGRELPRAELLRPYALALQRLEKDELDEETDLDALFRNSLQLAAKGKFAISLDGLLDILRQDKHYRDKLAHKTILGILEIMGNEDPLTREYRSELATVLF
jgi:putative thioredoxin